MKALIIILLCINVLIAEKIFLKISGDGHTEAISSIITDIDKHELITVSQSEKVIKIWDLDNKKLKKTITGNIGNDFGYINTVLHIKKYNLFLMGGKWTSASEHNDKDLGCAIKIYDINHSRYKKSLVEHKNVVGSLSKSNDEKYFVSTSTDGFVVWEVDTLKKVFKFDSTYGINRLITRANIIKIDNDYIVVTYDYSKKIQFFSLKKKALLKTISLKDIPFCLDYNDNNIVVGTTSGDIIIIDYKFNTVGTIKNDNVGIYSIAISENNVIAYSTGMILFNHENFKPHNSYECIVYDLKDKKVISKFSAHENIPHSIKFYNEYILSSSNKVYKWLMNDPTKYEVVVDSIGGEINSVGLIDNIISFGNSYDDNQTSSKIKNYSRDDISKQYAAKHGDFEYEINLENMKIKQKKKASANSILSNYKGLSLATMSRERINDNVLILNNNIYNGILDTKSLAYGLRTSFMSFGFLENGYILAGGEDGLLALFDIQGSPLIKFFGHTSKVSTFDVYKNKMISGAYDGTMKIWDMSKITTNNKILDENIINALVSQYQKDRDYFINGSDELKSKYNIDIYKNKVDSRNPLVSIFVDKNKEFVMWTEEGYFTVSSEKALKYITWHTNQGFEKEAIIYDLSKFYDVFFRPDLVKLKLQGKNITPYTKGLTVKDALKNPPPDVQIVTVNDIKIVHKKDSTNIAEANTTKDTTIIKFKISDIGGGVGTIRVYQEGKLIKTIGDEKINKIVANVDDKLQEKLAEKSLKENQLALLSKAIKGINLKIDEQIAVANKDETITNKEGNYEIEVPLKSGINQISIEAFNKTNNISSYRSSININANIPNKKSKLYAIIAGVNYFDSKYVQDLKYAVNDSRYINKLMEYTKRKVFNEVEIVHLEDEEVTKDNILKSLDAIKEKASLQDTIVFFMSTHGVSANGKFYLIPSNNTHMNDLIEFGEIFKNSSNIKSLNQIFIIDTCQSGNANDIASAVYDSRASVLARSTGIHLLSASTSGTNAFENDEYKHSNFTYQIMQTANNKNTDVNKDGFISIVEVSNAIKKLDVNNTKQFPVIQNIGRDILIKKIEIY